MDTTDAKVAAVLAAVRHVIQARTNWVLVGQDLCREIEAKVQAAPEPGGGLSPGDKP